MKKLLFLFLFLFLLFSFDNAFAKEIGDVFPAKSLEIYNQNDDMTGYPSTVISDLKQGSFTQTAFSYYKFSSDQNRVAYRWFYDSSSLQINKSYTLNFIIYSESWTKLTTPYRVVVKDSNGHISSCDIKSSSTAFYEAGNLDKPTSKYNPVVCNNAYFTSNSFYVYVYDSFESQGTVGISRISYSTSEEQSLTGVIVDNTDAIENQNKQQHDDAQKQLEETKKQTDFIKDDDTSSAQNSANDFFTNFKEDSHGLTGVITAPLGLLQSLTASKCEPLRFDLPIVKNEVSLPCMKSIYETYFGVFFSLWQIITTGLISYNVCLNFYKKVKDLQDPNNDKIEVLNL